MQKLRKDLDSTYPQKVSGEPKCGYKSEVSLATLTYKKPIRFLEKLTSGQLLREFMNVGINNRT